MVFEQLYSPSWLQKRPFIAFIMGVCYTSVSIGLALLFFPEDPSMAAVFLTSLVMIPTLNYLLSIEADTISRQKNTEFGIMRFITDHKDIMLVYFFLFLGTLLMFGIFNVIMPASARNYVFEKQLFAYSYEATHGAAISPDYAKFLLSRNIAVLFVCFIFSLIYGSGAILLISWNAAAWGSIFGDVAQKVSSAQGINPIWGFFRYLMPVLPHTLLEGSGYLLAAIAGGIISKAIVKEKWGSPNFKKMTQDSLIVLVIGVILIIFGAIVESSLKI